MKDIDKLKRSEIEKNYPTIKKEIIQFLKDNNLNLDWISNYKQVMYYYINNLKRYINSSKHILIEEVFRNF